MDLLQSVLFSIVVSNRKCFVGICERSCEVFRQCHVCRAVELKCDRRDLGDYWRGLGLGLAAVAVAGSPAAPPAPPPRCPSSSPALPPSPRLMSRSSPAPGGLSPNEWKRLLATGWHSARSPPARPQGPPAR